MKADLVAVDQQEIEFREMFSVSREVQSRHVFLVPVLVYILNGFPGNESSDFGKIFRER